MSTLQFHQGRPNLWLFGIDHGEMESIAESDANIWIAELVEEAKVQLGSKIPARIILHMEQASYLSNSVSGGAVNTFNFIKNEFGAEAYSLVSQCLERGEFDRPAVEILRKAYGKARKENLEGYRTLIPTLPWSQRFGKLFHPFRNLGTRMQASVEDPPFETVVDDMQELRQDLITMDAFSKGERERIVESLKQKRVYYHRSIITRDKSFSNLLLTQRFTQPDQLHVVIRGGHHVKSLSHILGGAFALSVKEQCLGDPLMEYIVQGKKTGLMADCDDELVNILLHFLAEQLRSLTEKPGPHASRARAIGERIMELTPEQILKWFDAMIEGVALEQEDAGGTLSVLE